MPSSSQTRRRRLGVVQRLLAELRAGRFESAITEGIVARAGPQWRLLRACALSRAGRLAAARADAMQALREAEDDPVVALVAGIVLFTTRDHQRALTCLERATGGPDDVAGWARQHAIGMAGILGWEHDVRRMLDAAVAAEPAEPRWHALAVRLLVRGRHHAEALEHARRALALTPEDASMWMEAASLHARLGEGDAASDALGHALSLAEPEREGIYRREAASVAIDAGDFMLAQECLERLVELRPRSPEPLIRLAELDTWRGHDDAANAKLVAALALDPGYGPALRLRGGMEVRAGDYEAALDTLERAIERAPDDYRAHLWRGEALARLGRFDEVHDPLHRGIAGAGGFPFVGWLVRLWAVIQQDDRPDEVLPPHRTEELRGVLEELCPEQAARAWETRRSADVAAAVEAALRALRGNRSVHGTHVVDGVLTRLTTRTGCRHESRWALQLIRVASPDECLLRFEDIIARYPGSSLPRCHRGELHLWLGNLRKAREDLEAAIATVKGTRWAYMGLSMLALLEGDPEACLRINAQGVRVMRNTEGAAIHVYRGEALRRLGRTDEAIAELKEAVRLHPSRVSAVIDLALAYADVGRDEELERLWSRLHREQAPGLLSDAAEQRGVTIVGDEGWGPERSVKVLVLEQALEMMGANRSSGLVTYWTARGQLRFVQRWPHGGEGPHDRDDRRLRQAERIVVQRLTG